MRPAATSGTLQLLALDHQRDRPLCFLDALLLQVLDLVARSVRLPIVTPTIGMLASRSA